MDHIARDGHVCDGVAGTCSLDSPLLSPLAPAGGRVGKRCSGRCRWCAFSIMFSCLVIIGLFLKHYWVFFRYARGYQWNFFVWCMLNAHAGLPCPPTSWNAPSGGCEALSVDSPPLLMLTADGLSSPEAQSMFTRLLSRAAANRAGSLGNETSASGNISSHLSEMGTHGVVHICDANYDAHVQSPGGFFDCMTYCRHRTEELMALGATHVACVLLDLAARADVTKRSVASASLLSFSSSASEFNYTDTDIASLLERASGVFVEGGGTLFLLKSLRRPLELAVQGAGHSPSFGDLLRSRVRSGTVAFIGVSAGSIVAGETASVALIWSDRGADAIGWNFTALQLVPRCVFLPHFQPQNEAWVQQYAYNLRNGFSVDRWCPDCGVMALPQCQPLGFEQASGASLSRLDYLCAS